MKKEWGIIAAGITAGIARAFRVRRAISFLDQDPVLQTDRTFPHRLFVLLPVVENPTALRAAYEWFGSLAKREYQDVQFVIVTGGQESETAETPALADRVAAYDDHWIHLHSNRSPYSKGAQLNFAIDHLDLRSDDWVAVYDIDGKPSRLPDPTDSIGRGSSVQQQVPLPGLAAGSRSNIFGNLDGVFQSAHVLLHEVSLWKMCERRSNLGVFDRQLRLPASYIWGNGLIIKKSALDTIGGFGEPIDDIPLGYRCTRESIPGSIRPEIVWHEQFPSYRRFYSTYSKVYRSDVPLSYLKQPILVDEMGFRIALSEARLWAARIVPLLPFLQIRSIRDLIAVTLSIELFYLPSSIFITAFLRDSAGRERGFGVDGAPKVIFLPLVALLAFARGERFLISRFSTLLKAILALRTADAREG